MCIMGMIEFVEWLRRMMEENQISQAELSRRSGLSASQVSKIYNGLSETSEDGYVAIARGLQIPPITVLRAAGIVPKEPEYIPLIDEWNAVFYDLTQEDRQEILEIAKLKASRHKKNSLKQSSRVNKAPARSALSEQ